MELVLHLGAQGHQSITFSEPLVQFRINCWWRELRCWLQQGGELHERLGINRIRFGSLQQGFGKGMGLGRIDHRRKPGLREDGCEGDPVGARGFKHNQDCEGWPSQREQVLLEMGVAAAV